MQERPTGEKPPGLEDVESEQEARGREESAGDATRRSECSGRARRARREEGARRVQGKGNQKSNVRRQGCVEQAHVIVEGWWWIRVDKRTTFANSKGLTESVACSPQSCRTGRGEKGARRCTLSMPLQFERRLTHISSTSSEMPPRVCIDSWKIHAAVRKYPQV